MDRRLPPDREAPEPVRIGIAAEQQSLIDEHRAVPHHGRAAEPRQHHPRDQRLDEAEQETADDERQHEQPAARRGGGHRRPILRRSAAAPRGARDRSRSEEHTSELQSLMRTSYAVFFLKKKRYTRKEYAERKRT